MIVAIVLKDKETNKVVSLYDTMSDSNIDAEFAEISIDKKMLLEKELSAIKTAFWGFFEEKDGRVVFDIKIEDLKKIIFEKLNLFITKYDFNDEGELIKIV